MSFEKLAEMFSYFRFLAICSQLPVPPQKHGNMMQASLQFHKENQKVKHGKDKIEALEVREEELFYGDFNASFK